MWLILIIMVRAQALSFEFISFIMLGGRVLARTNCSREPGRLYPHLAWCVWPACSDSMTLTRLVPSALRLPLTDSSVPIHDVRSRRSDPNTISSAVRRILFSTAQCFSAGASPLFCTIFPHYHPLHRFESTDFLPLRTENQPAHPSLTPFKPRSSSFPPRAAHAKCLARSTSKIFCAPYAASRVPCRRWPRTRVRSATSRPATAATPRTPAPPSPLWSLCKTGEPPRCTSRVEREYFLDLWVSSPLATGPRVPAANIDDCSCGAMT